MSLVLAAVGAVVASLLELTIAPYLEIGGARPTFVLVFTVIWTLTAGFEGGLMWAFVGGLMIDLLAPRPLGTTVFLLLLAVGTTSIVGRALAGGRYLVPILAVFLITLGYVGLLGILLSTLRAPTPDFDPVAVVGPVAAYNAVLAIVIGPLALALRDRYGEPDRVDW